MLGSENKVQHKDKSSVCSASLKERREKMLRISN